MRRRRSMAPEQIFPAAHGGPTLEQIDISQRNCGPLRTHARADFPDRTAVHEEPTTLEQIFLMDCSPSRTHAGAEERCEKEGAAENDCYMLTITPHPSSLLCRLGRERNLEEKNY
ncbi:hypothetical protein QYF61_008792 [Mycteria americana]|uniref:Uncharacterized protein n=1 Tax=Mycteria americana TaxID=33587 RepID=A0AAN7N8U4_MYCAM|nr:hypothetical protein QYF61_008792 [Mycteria americana]